MTLSVIDPKQPFQIDYQAAVNDLVKFLRGGLGENLHSIYLYGSVARKTAKPGQSNLDVIVVTNRSFNDSRTTLLNTIKWRFQQSFSHITEVSIKTALLSEVATLESIFSWGFQLRHCSVCIYGDDLSECFGDYEPSWEIAKHWNMDVEDWVAVYRNRIARASSPQEQVRAQKIIAKKLLRASHSLVMYRDKLWLEDPSECGEHFLRFYPMKKTEIDRLKILLTGRVIPKRSVIGILDSFGDWLVEQYKKTEFRIG
ncbi:nucleotidyltransferase domain-containing protein [Vibrio genomosp. F10]|uniref:Nucleotidyltransferase n=2 Tax=Vibrio genomosp. F10 TaxID=723171 RepID=A0A1B9QVW2_9VIBR|nr:nucleotidyltransferase domain-containing protein [Vibrio genomosp. F10]OCH73364.1 nucleotidyltransferase [Vibrio genomosp. F10]OEE37540.1 nucleotidyltransferase [Vibrio genomosp. F10 str. ZF-129]OEE97139.1 nucleotidyltransferase [Vibrio genomosp. F10 str. 9ZC157]OEF06665.1 nucleotidyltransferase [Vibrio genomosp. F10 str. 9ZD137]OEF07669.1 nucleotidyltransferase [Vibrio genomosp. F10 str. 9ZB36]